MVCQGWTRFVRPPAILKAYQEDGIPLPMGIHESRLRATDRMAVVIINPNKLRMSPQMTAFQKDQALGRTRDSVGSFKVGALRPYVACPRHAACAQQTHAC
eukprot:366431-Chlamydomonas_euryale.AAC.24